MKIIHGLSLGQVLQRRARGGGEAVLTGKCEATGPVTATILSAKTSKKVRGCESKGHARGGNFRVRLVKIPVGGPYRLVLACGDERVEVAEFYVGDVWILAGQSNMEGCGHLDRPTPVDARVRALYMHGAWGLARDPLHDVHTSPDPAHAPVRWSPRVLARYERLRRHGVGPGISFGKEMVRRSGGVPQGLIACAHGGTRMEEWDPRRRGQGGASLYGSLLRTWATTGQPIAGVLWYQGESDATPADAGKYYQRMVAFIRALRRDLRQPRLPILLAQLGRECNTPPPHDIWNSIQLDQLALARDLDYLDCVSTVDLPLDDGIHLSSEGQVRLGRRFAAAADRLVYRNRAELPAPEIKEVRRVRDLRSFRLGILALDVEFKNVVGELKADAMAAGFALMDANGLLSDRFFKAEARGNIVRLENSDLRTFEEYRLVYGFGRRPLCSLRDSRDMGVPIFGPVRISDTMALSAPFAEWSIGAPQPASLPVTEIAKPPAPENVHAHLQTRKLFITPSEKVPTPFEGLDYFYTEIEVPKNMRGAFLTGYDVPIRIWVDDEVVFTDANGINPLVIDEVKVPVKLKKGVRRIAVVGDFRGTEAWGFTLRFQRTDLTQAKIRAGNFRLPKSRGVGIT